MSITNKAKVPVGYLTISGLSQWLNRDRSVVRKVITENNLVSTKFGRYEYYRLSDFVDALYTGDRLDLAQERAKLAKEQRQKTALQVEEMRCQLVSVDVVGDMWVKMAHTTKTKILSLPSKLTARVHAAQSIGEVDTILQEEVREILTGIQDDVKSILN